MSNEAAEWLLDTLTEPEQVVAYEAALAAERRATVEEWVDLYVDSHRSDHVGLRASTALAAMVEDYFEAAGREFPLPRVDRRILDAEAQRNG